MAHLSAVSDITDICRSKHVTARSTSVHRHLQYVAVVIVVTCQFIAVSAQSYRIIQ